MRTHKACLNVFVCAVGWGSWLACSAVRLSEERENLEAAPAPEDDEPAKGRDPEEVAQAMQMWIEAASLQSANVEKLDGDLTDHKWDYMGDECFKQRYQIVAEEVLKRKCEVVIEVGGYMTPLDAFLLNDTYDKHQLPKMYINIDASISKVQAKVSEGMPSYHLPMTIADFVSDDVSKMRAKNGLTFSRANSCAVIFGIWDPHLNTTEDEDAMHVLLEGVKFAAIETSDYAKNWLDKTTLVGKAAGLNPIGDHDVDCRADMEGLAKPVTLLRHMRYLSSHKDDGKGKEVGEGKAKTAKSAAREVATKAKTEDDEEENKLINWFISNGYMDKGPDDVDGYKGGDGSTDNPNWKYLETDCMKKRYKHIAKDILAKRCKRVVEVGGYLTPVDGFLRNLSSETGQPLPSEYINIDPSMPAPKMFSEDGMRSVHLKLTLADFLDNKTEELRHQFDLDFERPTCGVLLGIWTPHFATDRDKGAMKDIWKRLTWAVLETTSYSLSWVVKTIKLAKKEKFKEFQKAQVDCSNELKKPPWRLKKTVTVRELRWVARPDEEGKTEKEEKEDLEDLAKTARIMAKQQKIEKKKQAEKDSKDSKGSEADEKSDADDDNSVDAADELDLEADTSAKTKGKEAAKQGKYMGDAKEAKDVKVLLKDLDEEDDESPFADTP
eukprot:TRINITY_DN90450_c0_g1_i1.p1 TRINITY_DN90450_c0_g1~~TRINITY_DN90450_c0_g1_i1.p1  ORF type:complete len:665 (+),score=230.13 TRINITY_DN90450_c0_g1_i1:101-2095(+)